MRLLFLIFPFLASAQTVQINGTGRPVTINAPGQSSSVNIPLPPPVDWSPVAYEGEVNQTIQNLTIDDEQGYYIGKMTYAVGQKRGIIVRLGTAHAYSPSTQIIKYETSDGANTWTRTVLHSETNIDSRNLAGGTTSNGTVIGFYGRLADTGWVSIRVMRSTDGAQTFTHSSDLELYPGVTGVFSPHGRLVEFDDGTLMQCLYGSDDNDIAYNWTVISEDDGVTWTTHSLINSGVTMYEPEISYLGAGKMIAIIRDDITTTDKNSLVYNSDDYGSTWDSIGKCTWGAGFDAPGTSPLLFKKDSDNAYFIQNFRSAYNQLNEAVLPFGTATITGLTRRFAPGNPVRVGENLHYGYHRDMDFKMDTADMLCAWYDLSTEYVSGSPITDIWVGPIFRKQIVQTTKTSGTYASGLSTYSPGAYVTDEFPSYNNDSQQWQHILRESGGYTVDVTAVFTGNTTGTYRRLTLELWNSATDSYVSDILEVQQTNLENSFSFSNTAARNSGDAVVLRVEHDATGSITVSNILLTITKNP